MSRMHAPLLIAVDVWLDRAIVLLTLAAVMFALLWAAIFERGLGQPWNEAARQLIAVWHGQVAPI